MNLSPRLSERTPAELLARAAEYRRMAETASTADVRDALLRLAERLEAMAARRSPDDRTEGKRRAAPPGGARDQ